MRFTIDPTEPCKFSFVTAEQGEFDIHDHEDYNEVWYELTVIKHLLDNALGQITITDALPETLDFLANPDPGVAYAPIAVYINDRDHRLTFTPGA